LSKRAIGLRLKERGYLPGQFGTSLARGYVGIGLLEVNASSERTLLNASSDIAHETKKNKLLSQNMRSDAFKRSMRSDEDDDDLEPDLDYDEGEEMPF